jgi:hypothetical protein
MRAGMMVGLSVQGSTIAAGLLWGLFAAQCFYALLVTVMRPFIDYLAWVTEATSLWLEAVMVLYAALLFAAPGNKTYQNVSVHCRMVGPRVASPACHAYILHA